MRAETLSSDGAYRNALLCSAPARMAASGHQRVGRATQQQDELQRLGGVEEPDDRIADLRGNGSQPPKYMHIHAVQAVG